MNGKRERKHVIWLETTPLALRAKRFEAGLAWGLFLVSAAMIVVMLAASA